MNRERFKTRVGLLLISTHFLILVWLVISYFIGGFKFSELTTSLALMMPLFASYTTVIVKDFIANMEVKTPTKVEISKPFVYVTFLIITVFSIYLFTIVFLKAFNLGLNDFEEFKSLLAISETMFGVYIGQIIFSIYKRKNKD